LRDSKNRDYQIG